MDEIYELKKALLQERRQAGMLAAQLADLQLKLLEDEQKAKPVEAEIS